LNYAALRYVIERSPTEGAAWQVLVVIAHHADKRTGEAYVSRRTLAKEARLSTGTVHYVLDDLVARGLLEIVVEGAGRRAMTYRVVIPGTSSDSPAESQPAAQSVSHNKAVVAQSPDRSGSIHGSVVAQLTGPSIGGREKRREDLEGTSAAAPAAAAEPTADALGSRSGRGNGVPPAVATELAKLRAETAAKRVAAQEAERARLERLYGPAASEPASRDPPAQVAL
jgi:DNA-binding transcriptional MocR family regulator